MHSSGAMELLAGTGNVSEQRALQGDHKEIEMDSSQTWGNTHCHLLTQVQQALSKCLV